ncbi:unnamed protein product [Calypogeia fissa]
MDSIGTWKERNPKRPWYKLLNSAVSSSSHVTANWHGIPAAKEDLEVHFSPDFIAQHITPTACSRLVISFEDKLAGELANQWVADFALREGYELRIQKSFSTGFHILQILGSNSETIRDSLLQSTTLSAKGWHVVVSPLKDDTDLEYPTCLKQLIKVTFVSSLSWIEAALDLLLAGVGSVVSYRKHRKGSLCPSRPVPPPSVPLVVPPVAAEEATTPISLPVATDEATTPISLPVAADEATTPILLAGPTPTLVSSLFTDDVRTPSSPPLVAALLEEIPVIILGDSPPTSPPAAEPIPADINIAAPKGAIFDVAVPVVAISEVVAEEVLVVAISEIAAEEEICAVPKELDLDLDTQVCATSSPAPSNSDFHLTVELSSPPLSPNIVPPSLPSPPLFNPSPSVSNPFVFSATRKSSRLSSLRASARHSTPQLTSLHTSLSLPHSFFTADLSLAVDVSHKRSRPSSPPFVYPTFAPTGDPNLDAILGILLPSKRPRNLD